MAELMSGGIHFSGLASGSDFDSMITQLKKVESIQMNRMKLWKGDWQKRVDAFGTINTEIQNFQSTVQKMDTMAEFLAKSATSSFDTVATATTDSKASEGVYKIEVGQLAKNSMWTYNTGFASKTAKVNTSGANQTFQYTYKGKQRTLTVASNTTVEGLVNLINSDPQNPGVKAALIKNGDQYNLQIRGMGLGAANALSIDAGTNLTNLQAPDSPLTNWNYQAAQNALIRVNDWPAGSFIESSSNTVSEVIEGLTINLKDVGTTQLTVGTDLEKIKQNIQDFVDGMNAVRTKMLELTKVDSNAKASDPNDESSQFDAEKGSVLTGNYGVQLLSSRLKLAVSGRAEGFDYYSDANGGEGDYYSTLAHIGILTVADQSDKDNGLLRVDMEKLDEALAKDPTAVAELFAADGIGTTDSQDFSFYSQVKGITKPGIYDVSYDVDATGNIINAKIGGQNAKVDQNTHQISSLTGDSRGMVIQVNNLVAGSYSDTVRLKQGKAGQMDALLKDVLSSDGTLKIIEKNYEDIMDEIDKKIERETSRIIRWERSMRLKFARLESTLTKYNGQMESLNKQVAQLAQQ
ncbi:flagellar filament capping protein FliD [Desulfovibrio mangrovi]|uniref:flagellar filament capping protein FliD n=1 Tax=Desulfovibrio mangrovi TaxID=2976983 RepID=UPI002247F462|nr:flagellar filament capping protein FliD [Desulfovibrio mangrovi]UZP68922.1 flagellar filament capping protein FliD [Desulfovibrio mangrovi]